MAASGAFAAPTPGIAPLPRRWRHNPAIIALNPYFLQTATAVVTRNDKTLRSLAVRMEKFAASKTKPYLHFPATRALVFIRERLADKAAYVSAFQRLCVAKGNRFERAQLSQFIKTQSAWLAEHQKSSWAFAGAGAALTRGGGTVSMAVYRVLVHDRLAGLKRPAQRVRFLKRAVAHVNRQIAGSRGRHAASNAARMLEDLRYLAVVNAGYSMRQLNRQARVYLAVYRLGGAHSAEVFWRALSGTDEAYKLAMKAAAKKRVIREGAWLMVWHDKFVRRGSGYWSKSIAAAWDTWKRIKLNSLKDGGSIKR